MSVHVINDFDNWMLCLAKLAYQIRPRKMEDDEIQDDAWPYREMAS